MKIQDKIKTYRNLTTSILQHWTKTIQIFLLCVVLSPNANTQSVETFIDMAKAYNPELKALNLEYQAALQKIDQVNEWPDPTVNLAVGVLPVETRLGSQEFRIGASQMIPWKGSLTAKGSLAKAMAEEKANIDEVREIDIEYAIHRAYSMLQYLENQKEVILNRLQVLDVMEEMAKSAVRTGKGKLSNVLMIERKREELEANLLLLEKKKEQPVIMINRWSGRDLNAEITISPVFNELITESEVLEFAQNSHPQFQVLQNRLNASNAAIDLIQYDSKPKIGVGLDYSWISKRKDVDIPNNGRDVLMPMVSVSVPLNTRKYGAKRQEETLRQQAIDAQVSEFQDKFTAEVRMAFNSIEYQNQVIEKYESLKEITKETLQLMRTEYASEGTRFEELLRLEMDLIDYDQMILAANYEKDVARATLLKYKL